MTKFTKQNMIERIAELDTIASKKAAGEVLDLILANITEQILAGNEVYLGQNFGGFSQVTKAAKAGKALGVEYSVPARKAIKFKPSSALRTTIAGN